MEKVVTAFLCRLPPNDTYHSFDYSRCIGETGAEQGRQGDT